MARNIRNISRASWIKIQRMADASRIAFGEIRIEYRRKGRAWVHVRKVHNMDDPGPAETGFPFDCKTQIYPLVDLLARQIGPFPFGGGHRYSDPCRLSTWLGTINAI